MTSSVEKNLTAIALDQLRAAGFVVGSDVALSAEDPSRADIVAWISDSEGRLAPALVVEVKSDTLTGLNKDAALTQLATHSNALGTAHAFVFDGKWYRADETFTRLQESPTPLPAAFQHEGTASETSDAFRRALWLLAANLRDQGRQLDVNELVGHVGEAVGKVGSSGVRLLDDLLRNVPRGKVLDEVREALERIAATQRPELTPTPHALSDAIAALARPRNGDLVEDPFAGFGNCLWSVHAWARSHRIDVHLRGSDLSPERVQVAQTLARLGEISAHLDVADFFAAAQPLASVVVADPPIGIRASTPHSLSFGGDTTDLDVAILDRLVDRLPAEGRLVQVVPPKVLFGEGPTGRLRGHLAQTVRVVSVIELPPKVLRWTAIRCAVVVIEKRRPTPTLMARLGDDWPQQLAPGGSFLAEYVRHLEAV